MITQGTKTIGRSLAVGGAMLLLSAHAFASANLFAPFIGEWEGDGTIRFGGGAKERMRCTAEYNTQDTRGHELTLVFHCKSDNYAFVLDGRVVSDAKGTLTGRWTETSRNIGGIAFGKVEDERVRVRIESSGFGANLLIAARDDRQRVSIKSLGGGEEAEAQITLKRK